MPADMRAYAGPSRSSQSKPIEPSSQLKAGPSRTAKRGQLGRSRRKQAKPNKARNKPRSPYSAMCGSIFGAAESTGVTPRRFIRREQTRAMTGKMAMRYVITNHALTAAVGFQTADQVTFALIDKFAKLSY